tara:strand:- start:67 stop:348 length:282 start_codon:yes stop_codon:yes gene_type:complete
MEEKTSDEIAEIFSAAGDSVNLINLDANFAAYTSRTGDSSINETEWKTIIARNVEHLELIKAYKKIDGTTSIWTSEDFTDIDAAITTGKAIYS